MPRGGKREPGPGKKLGRTPKEKIVLSATKGMASAVLNSIPEQEYWRELLRAELQPAQRCDLDIGEKRLIKETLQYLTDRRDGKPAQGVFVGDTREGREALGFGNLPMPAHDAGATGKPN